jgi:hypothetical protein
MMSARLHSGLAGYMSRQKMTAQQTRTDDALVLTIDTRYRIFCRPGPHGDVVLESHLLQLPERRNEADEIIRECLLGSWVRMMEHADVPVLSNNENELLLQQRVTADVTVDEFENALEQFTNSLADWRRIFRVL